MDIIQWSYRHSTRLALDSLHFKISYLKEKVFFVGTISNSHNWLCIKIIIEKNNFILVFKICPHFEIFIVHCLTIIKPTPSVIERILVPLPALTFISAQLEAKSGNMCALFVFFNKKFHKRIVVNNRFTLVKKTTKLKILRKTILIVLFYPNERREFCFLCNHDK